MTKKQFAGAFYVLMIVSLVAVTTVVSAASLNLIVAPDRQVYNVGDTITIDGSLTDGGSPVSDAIVAVEVDNPVGGIFSLRTLNTGPLNPNQTWPLEILEIIPCSSDGSLKQSFQPGGNAGFKISIRNNAANPNDIIAMITLTYSNQAPFTTFLMYNGSIAGEHTKTVVSYPAVAIPDDAITGNTTVYANVFNFLPRDNGFAYCPEKTNWFRIDSSSPISPAIINETFPLELSLSGITVRLRNYTIYATTQYGFSTTSTTSQFEVILIGDLTGPEGEPDGKVDMRDIALVARQFGTEEGDPDWNPDADLTGPEHMVPDGKVDMRDVAFVARLFGTVAIP